MRIFGKNENKGVSKTHWCERSLIILAFCKRCVLQRRDDRKLKIGFTESESVTSYAVRDIFLVNGQRVRI